MTWRIAAALIGLAASGIAQELSYEKYALENGMTVILHEDHSLPIVSVNLWYDVGAKDEPRGRSGFAHLFEHLMFMGTERVPGGEFDTIMEGGGGANNASTSLDRTKYYSWGPAGLLPTLLWLEADRLEDLGRSMDQKKLDLQRDVVRNERRQTVENQPYGRSRLELVKMLFPEGHPYHESTIGSHADLQAATVQDVREFFANYYIPSNLSLVVAGDFDGGAVKAQIAALFASLPGGRKPRASYPPAPVLHGERRFTTLDRVQLPMIRYGWLSPVSHHEGDAELELAAAILGKEKSGWLYRRLVVEQALAAQVSVGQQSQALGSMFTISILARPGADLDAIERIVDEEIARLAQEGPGEEELERLQAEIELRALSSLQRLNSRADMLNQYEFYYGEPNSVARDLARYRDADVGSVKRWVKQVLVPDARAIVRILPEDPHRGPTARDERPAAAPAEVFRTAEPQELSLPGGIPLQLWSRTELPLVQVTLAIDGGSVLDRPRQAGLATLVADMLDEGAGTRDAIEFAAALELLGARLEVRAEREETVVTLFALRRNLDAAVALMADAVLRPRFDPKDWERVKRLRLEELKQLADQPVELAARVAAGALYGTSHPYGQPAGGTLASVSAIELGDVRAAYARGVRPGAARFLAAGDIDGAELGGLLAKHFGSWKAAAEAGAGEPARAWGAIPARDALQVLIVDRPGAVQTVIRFELPSIALGDPRRVPYRILGMVLGGSFTSRLNQNLREDKGYTYGAGSRYFMAPHCGSLVAFSSVRTAVTGPALAEFLAEFARMRKGGLTQGELQRAVLTLRTEAIQAQEDLRGIVSSALDLMAAGLPLATTASDLQAMQKLDTRELDRLAAEAIPLEHGVLVLVGDAAAICPQIEKIGLGPAVLVENADLTPDTSRSGDR